MRKVLFVSISLALGLAALLAAPVTGASDSTCPTETLQGVTVDDVTIAEGGNCNIRQSTVEGNLKLENHATATLYCGIAEGVTVHGDVWVEQAGTLYSAFCLGEDHHPVIIGGDVRGKGESLLSLVGHNDDPQVYDRNVVIKGAIESHKARAVNLQNLEVFGDVRVSKAAIGPFIVSNSIAGDLWFEKNGDGTIVLANTIGGDCQGRKNKEPVTSSGNTAGGNIEGQCN